MKFNKSFFVLSALSAGIILATNANASGKTVAQAEPASPNRAFFKGHVQAPPVVSAMSSYSSVIDVTAVKTTDGATEIHVTTNGLVRQPKATKEGDRLSLVFENFGSSVTDRTVAVNTTEVSTFALKGVGRDSVLDLDLKQYGQFSTRTSANTFVLKIYPVPGTPSITPLHAFASTIKNVNFTRTKSGEEKAIVNLSATNAVVDVKQENSKIFVRFPGTQFPAGMVKNRFFNDTKAVYSSAKSYNVGDEGVLELAVNGNYEYVVYQLDNQVIISVSRKVAGGTATSKPSSTVYSGKKISMDFQNAEIRRIIQVLSEYTGQNIVASDSVQGTISLNLKEVPWEQALNIITKSKGLAQRRDGSVILVAPIAEITRFEELEATAYTQSLTLSPLITKVIQLNYAKAKDVAEMLRAASASSVDQIDSGANRILAAAADDSSTSLLSNRGSVSIDERTNTLAVSDTAEKINEIKGLIEQIDIPVRQVMIEARIVRASTSFSKSLGVKWGFMKKSGVSIASDMTNLTTQYNNRFSGDGETIDSNVNIDLGQTLGTSSIALGLINTSNTLLGLELSALQSDGLGEVLSTPKVLTGDKQEATIRSGVRLPYQTTSGNNGTTTIFQDAVLELLVTPSITPEGTVQMTLEVSKDSQGELTDAGYAIDTNKLKTNVLVNDGETIVLGGLFEETRNNGYTKVPFFGDIPLVGNLFKSKTKSESRQELLIFVTPKIFNDPTEKSTLANLGDSKLISSISSR